MKIVYVSDAVYPYNKGGKEKRLYELSTRLASRGHDVHIYTMHWWKGPERERVEDGVHLHAISRYYPLYSGDKRSIKEGLLFGLACLKLLRIQFDVLDVDHMPFFPVLGAWLICKLRSKRLYGTWHEALTTSDWLSYMGKSGHVAAAIERLSIRLPDTITAASNQTKRILADYHRRTERVGLVASGIDTQLIRRVRPVASRCDVLYAGRLVKDKNVDKLVRAFAIVARQNEWAQCVIIGHGVERQNIERLIRALHLDGRVHILDPLPDAKDVYAYMKRAKVFVLPSVREGFGIVALEALACNTPVVTIDAQANAAKELITPGKTGSIARLEPESLAAAIDTWLGADAKRNTLTDNIEDYDWNNLADRQIEVYA